MSLILFSKLLLHLSEQRQQNDRLLEVGEDLWRPSSSTPYSKQGHLQKVAQGCVVDGFWMSPRMKALQILWLYPCTGEPRPGHGTPDVSQQS